MQTWRSNLKSLSIFPVPKTTDASGSSAMETGKTGFFADALVEIFEQSASACQHNAAIADVGGSSGGARSSATRTAFRIVATHCLRQFSL